MFVRHTLNPLIRPDDLQPSRPDFEVIGTFNAGAIRHNDEVLLLLRVAERPVSQSSEVVLCPHLGVDGELVITRIPRDDGRYDLSDSRMVRDRRTGDLLLTSISHLRLARSHDGVHFTVDAIPWLSAAIPEEGYGVEDARITRIEDTYYINYTAVSRYGIATGLVTTQDFVHSKREGIIFPPANRDVAIFPQRINGLYACYHRPMPSILGTYNIWMATSPDLRHWGQHRPVLETQPDSWEAGRVGGGAPPLYTEQGWLSIYHAADKKDRYCLGAFLTPHDDPGRVIARSHQPILVPDAHYEQNGFFPNVVFTCGALLDGDLLRVYYGAADAYIALAEVQLEKVLNQLTPIAS